MNETDRELVTDYVLGEMSAVEREAFEARMHAEPELARAVSVEEEALALGILAGVTEDAAPSTEIKTRLMAGLPVKPRATPAEVLPFNRFAGWGWGVAAALAVVATMLGLRVVERASEIQILTSELAAARGELTRVADDLASVVGDREALAARVASLESGRRIDTLRIAAMSSQLDQAAAYGYAVFDPASDEGVLEVINLPQIDPATQDYQLWVVDPQYANPVDGGVVTVDASGNTKVRFTAKQPVADVAAFAISLERKGGVPVAEGPMVLVGGL